MKRKYSAGQTALLFVMGLLTGAWIGELVRTIDAGVSISGPLLGLVSALGISAFVAFSGRMAATKMDGETDGK